MRTPPAPVTAAKPEAELALEAISDADKSSGMDTKYPTPNRTMVFSTNVVTSQVTPIVSGTAQASIIGINQPK